WGGGGGGGAGRGGGGGRRGAGEREGGRPRGVAAGREVLDQRGELLFEGAPAHDGAAVGDLFVGPAHVGGLAGGGAERTFKVNRKGSDRHCGAPRPGNNQAPRKGHALQPTIHRGQWMPNVTWYCSLRHHVPKNSVTQCSGVS